MTMPILWASSRRHEKAWRPESLTRFAVHLRSILESRNGLGESPLCLATLATSDTENMRERPKAFDLDMRLRVLQVMSPLQTCGGWDIKLCWESCHILLGITHLLPILIRRRLCRGCVAMRLVEVQGLASQLMS